MEFICLATFTGFESVFTKFGLSVQIIFRPRLGTEGLVMKGSTVIGVFVA